MSIGRLGELCSYSSITLSTHLRDTVKQPRLSLPIGIYSVMPIKLTPPSFFTMVYRPNGVDTTMCCLVFSTTPYIVPEGARFTFSTADFAAFATSLLSFLAKLVVVAATTISNEIIIFFIVLIFLFILYALSVVTIQRWRQRLSDGMVLIIQYMRAQ